MLSKRVIGLTYILDWKKQQALMNYGGKVHLTFRRVFVSCIQSLFPEMLG